MVSTTVFFGDFDFLAIESALRRNSASVDFASRGFTKRRAPQAIATAIRLIATSAQTSEAEVLLRHE
jgi:hypothetical protein